MDNPPPPPTPINLQYWHIITFPCQNPPPPHQPLLIYNIGILLLFRAKTSKSSVELSAVMNMHNPPMLSRRK